MARKQKIKEEGPKSNGIIVTHPENHITPRNAQTLWLVAMMTLIGFVGGIATIILWEKEQLGWQIDRMHMIDNGAYVKRWAREYQDKTRMMYEPAETKMDFSYLLLENFDLYQKLSRAEIESMQHLFPKCGETDGDSSLAQNRETFDGIVSDIIDSGDVYALILPGKTLYYTTRPEALSDDFMPAFLSLSNACGELGTLHARDIRSDKIIWMNLHCGGVAVTPEDGAQAYEDFQSCQRSVDALNEWLVNS